MAYVKALVMFCFSLFLCLSAVAKAPVSEGTNPKERHPAGASHMESLPQFEQYMDMTCESLVNKNSKDEFIIFFRNRTKEIHTDICSIVGDVPTFEDQDLAQSEMKMIGRGSFSNLLEGHFNEFIHDKKLSIYQNLDCKKMTNIDSSDGFIRFFAAQMAEINIKLCDDLGLDQTMDSDISQAESPIGRGTYSKLIETYYDEYHHGQ